MPALRVAADEKHQLDPRQLLKQPLAPAWRTSLRGGRSVAVEIAMKMAIENWINRGQPQKTKFLNVQTTTTTATPRARWR